MVEELHFVTVFWTITRTIIPSLRLKAEKREPSLMKIDGTFFPIYWRYLHSRLNIGKLATFLTEENSRDRIVVSTLRCGRSNPGSNPGHGILFIDLSFVDCGLYCIQLMSSFGGIYIDCILYGCIFPKTLFLYFL